MKILNRKIEGLNLLAVSTLPMDWKSYATNCMKEHKITLSNVYITLNYRKCTKNATQDCNTYNCLSLKIIINNKYAIVMCYYPECNDVFYFLAVMLYNIARNLKKNTTNW